MLDKNKVRYLLATEMALDANADYEIYAIWDELIDILRQDSPSTINFILNDCTEEEYAGILEISDDLSFIFQSKAFIEALEKTADKYPSLKEKYNISGMIFFAKQALHEES